MHAPTSHDHHFAPLSSLCPAATLPPRRPPDIDGPPGALRRSLEPSSIYLSITFQPTSTRSHRMSILVITHISCHGKDYECRRKVDIADGTIPVGDIVRFFWPRLAPNFTCKSIRSFDGDLEDFVDVENPEAHFVKAKDKYEFRYAEADGTASHSSILHNSFYCKAESTPNGVAFYVQKSQNPQKQSNGETSAATNGNIVNLISPVKVIVKSEPTSAFDLPSTSTNPERSRDSSSHPSPQGNITLNDNYCFDAKADQIVEKSNSGSPASGSSAQKDEFGDQLNEFFNNQDLLNNYSALFNPNGTTSEPSAPEEVTPSRVVPNDMDMSTLVVPNAIEHLQTQVERGQYALAELRKYANGEVSFFEDQVKRIITLAMGDYLFDNYFDSCNAPVRREFCRRYLAQLPGKLRLEIFSNSKTVGTVDCYIKNKKKRIRKIAMRENGCPPAKRACTMKPVEPPPERPRPPALLNEMNSGKVDPFSSEMIVLYKKTNAYRQTLINALNKTPGVEPVDEVVKEFPLLAKNATLLDQDFYMATSRLQSDTVDFEDEWNTEWAPRIEKYFDTVSPNKHAQLERMYGNVPDRQNFKAFLMVFSLLEYNALSLGQVKTMIVECHSMSIADAVVDVRVHKDIKDPLILANEVGFRVCVGNVTLPLTATFATALKQLVQVHYVFRISHKVLFRPIYQVLETIYGLSTNALRFSQRALSLVENLRSAGCCE
uniref:SET domain-containing protein n=1 Tax=Panagrellus redivivus TaxID=6233 RepID=A0A7E4W4X3_PANRE